jgi:hypothetical protein
MIHSLELRHYFFRGYLVRTIFFMVDLAGTAPASWIPSLWRDYNHIETHYPSRWRCRGLGPRNNMLQYRCWLRIVQRTRKGITLVPFTHWIIYHRCLSISQYGTSRLLVRESRSSAHPRCVHITLVGPYWNTLLKLSMKESNLLPRSTYSMPVSVRLMCFNMAPDSLKSGNIVLLYPDDDPLALDILPYHTISTYILSDGAYTRLDLGALLTTRECGNKCVGTNY